MINAAAARDWLTAALGPRQAAAQLVGLSTNLAATGEFGIAPEHVFGFRDWVGGRFSLWSSVGLSIALAAGWPAFAALLEGAWEMDRHFRDTPPAANLPVLLALAGIWHIDLLGCRTHALLAYDDRLRLLPAFLQQLEMESNGKSVGLDGAPVAHPTGPVLFGGPGTDVQHSFMQLVHQGTQLVPVDFILCAEPAHDRADAHRVLAANAIAQAEALLAGRDLASVQAEMAAAGADPAEIARVAPHRVFSGDRPSQFILLDRLSPGRLGALIALYEHKVAVQGAIWGINSFDQWGVELGKQLCGALLPDLAPGAPPPSRASASTAALIARFRALRGER
jgi:glucose-6-phosphate isomerase